MPRLRSHLAILALSAGLAGCAADEVVPEAYWPSNAWDAYRRGLQDAGLAGTALGLDWRRSADEALRNPVEVDLPYVERGVFDPRQAHAFGYQFEVARGQSVAVRLMLDGPSPQVFVDVFRAGTEEPTPVASADEDSRSLTFEPRQDGNYVLRVQPELMRGGDYELRIEVNAALGFPVADLDVGAIQSAFGAPRDAGRRSHHGVDIFAPRGTPAVAATRAYVRRVREQGLGGLVVWLHDRERNLHLYYAHLDEQLVEQGQWVDAGDIVGRVGNTGNARTTPPHLHFAIYADGAGPIDPDPFLRQPRRRMPALRADLTMVGGEVLAGRDTRLRAALSARATSLGVLLPGTPLRVWAAAADSYRVALQDGTLGYVSAAAIAPPVAAGND